MVEIAFQLRTEVGDVGQQRLRLPVPRVAVGKQLRCLFQVLVFERLDFDPAHRRRTIVDSQPEPD